MKLIFIILLIELALVFGNNKTPNLFTDKSNYAINFQLLDSFADSDINKLSTEIEIFFHRKVTILKLVSIPVHYYDTITKMYSADSILNFLSHLNLPKKSVTLGLTHKPLFRIDYTYTIPKYDEGILGYTYQNGTISVATDNNIGVNKTIPISRLRNDIIHEFGHIMGLLHCPNPNCAMSKRNCGPDYCDSCKKKLKI